MNKGRGQFLNTQAGDRLFVVISMVFESRCWRILEVQNCRALQ